LWRNDPEEYKRFRADSFVTWLKWLEQTADETDTDPQADALAARLEVHIEAELTAAGLTRADVPKRTGSWRGGNFRARLADLDLEHLYLIFFSTHSYYVHGSWHELRAFHLHAEADGLHLDETYGGLSPPAAYEIAIVVFDAVADYVRAMPVPTLDADAFISLAERSKAAAAEASAFFASYLARGGLEELLDRHSTK
jgi:hypothetical protein